jgi:hypothetical protein
MGLDQGVLKVNPACHCDASFAEAIPKSGEEMPLRGTGCFGPEERRFRSSNFEIFLGRRNLADGGLERSTGCSSLPIRPFRSSRWSGQPMPWGGGCKSHWIDSGKLIRGRWEGPASSVLHDRHGYDGRQGFVVQLGIAFFGSPANGNWEYGGLFRKM